MRGDYIWLKVLSPYVTRRLGNLESSTMGGISETKQDANIILRPYHPALNLCNFQQPFWPLSVHFWVYKFLIKFLFRCCVCELWHRLTASRLWMAPWCDWGPAKFLTTWRFWHEPSVKQKVVRDLRTKRCRACIHRERWRKDRSWDFLNWYRIPQMMIADLLAGLRIKQHPQKYSNIQRGKVVQSISYEQWQNWLCLLWFDKWIIFTPLHWSVSNKAVC